MCWNSAWSLNHGETRNQGPSMNPYCSNLDGYQQLMKNYLTLKDDSSQGLADKIKQEAIQKKLNKMMQLKMNLMGN